MLNNPLEQSLINELSSVSTPEFLQVMLLGLQSLTKFGYTDHEVPLLNCLEVGASEELVQQTYSIIEDGLEAICRLHRIQLNESVEIEILARLVDALWLMQEWSDGATIVSIAQSDAEDVEKLASLVALVGTIGEEDVLTSVAEIDEGFMNGLVNIYNSGSISIMDDTVADLDQDQLVKIRLWREKMAADKTVGIRMIRTGYMPGGLFEEYLAKAASMLATKTNDDIAHDICSLLLISRDGWHNMLLTWREHSSNLDLEPQHINAIDVKIAKLLAEFERLKGIKP